MFRKQSLPGQPTQSEMMLTTRWPTWVYRLEWLAVGVLSAGSLMLFLLAFMLE